METLDLFFSEGLAIIERHPTEKLRRIKVRKTLDQQICFYLYLVHDSSKEATELAKKKKVRSFHEVQS
jgi:hypothetical protein